MPEGKREGEARLRTIPVAKRNPLKRDHQATTPKPHECRHSYVTHLRAAGVNDANLAQIAGHRIETMLARYTHAVGGSFGEVRRAIG
jgi:Phage integrase family.